MSRESHCVFQERVDINMFEGMGIIYGFIFAVTIFWIWMLVDCLLYVRSDGNDKLLWTLVIFFAGWLGALIYFLVQRPKNIEH